MNTSPHVRAQDVDLVAGRREQAVREFFAEWGRSPEAFTRSFDLLADDCVWDQRPVPRVRGPVGARRFLTVARRSIGLLSCDVDILGVAVDGDVVHVERVDHLRRGDGSLIASAPVAGVMTFTGDQITHWREYFDATTFAGQALATTATHVLRRARDFATHLRR